MAHLVYIDETGSVGKGAHKQPELTLVAVMVAEDKVQSLGEAFREIAWKHLQWVPSDFELHGNQVWNATGHWTGKSPEQIIAVYEDAIAELDQLDIDVSFASIHKKRLYMRYSGLG